MGLNRSPEAWVRSGYETLAWRREGMDLAHKRRPPCLRKACDHTLARLAKARPPRNVENLRWTRKRITRGLGLARRCACAEGTEIIRISRPGAQSLCTRCCLR